MTKNKDKMGLRGRITLELKDKDGKVKDKREIKNTITNAGLAIVADLVGDVSGAAAAFDYLAVGTGTTAAAATDTALETEITDTGLARAQDASPTRTTTTATNDTLTLNYTWTASGAKAVTECGIFNAAVAGTLLGHQVFSAINTANGDTLAVTYDVVFS